MFRFYALSTLFPIIILSIFIYTSFIDHVKIDAEQQLVSNQQHNTRLIQERLALVSTNFKAVSQRLNLNSSLKAFSFSLKQKARLLNWFSSISVLDPNKNIKHILGAPSLDIRSVLSNNIDIKEPGQHLRTSKSGQIFITEALTHRGGKRVYIAEVRHNYIVDPSLLSKKSTACIVNTEMSPISCSEPLLKSVRPILNEKHNGTNDYARHLLKHFEFWKLETISLQPYFDSPAWVFLAGKTSLQVWGGYTTLFIVVSLFLIMMSLLGFLLSIKHTGHYIQPLKHLKEGIQNVANQQLNTEVRFRSKDEFEDIAELFNVMSTRVSKHFNAMEMMSRIDRLILSTFDIENIIETILVRMGQIVPCDSVSVLINSEQDNDAYLYYLGDHFSTKIHKTEVVISDCEIKKFEANPEHLIVENNGLAPPYLSPIKKHHSAFLVLPIFLSQHLSAAIILGYYNEPNYTPQDIIQARDLAHRVAVALSNATWEDKLYYKAHYDPLTNLPNRLLFHDRLEHAITRAKRDHTQVGLMFIDLDRFKFINDSLGHDSGDDFLIETAKRLKSCVRSVDTVSRLGGDEFTVIIPDLEMNSDATHDLSHIGSKIIETLLEPFNLSGQEVNSSGSIGISIYPRDADNYSDLLKNADSAMYYAKASGKSNYQFYSEDLNTEAKALLVLESQLHHAIERDEFELYYQPRIDSKTGKVLSAEALIRWHHPEKGLLLPESFIHVAEESGLIRAIGDWVISEACKQMVIWQRQGYPDLCISVNLSAYQFHAENMLNYVKQALFKSGLEPKFLEIEITEGTLLQDIETTMETMRHLSNMNIKLAIDDFGTGYSSLSYLKKFPIDSLKIDQSFVQNLCDDKDNYAIVSAIITLAHSLDLRVIAEGVEQQAELHILQKMNCDEVQGFFYAKPLSKADFLNFLNSQPN